MYKLKRADLGTYYEFLRQDLGTVMELIDNVKLYFIFYNNFFKPCDFRVINEPTVQLGLQLNETGLCS